MEVILTCAFSLAQMSKFKQFKTPTHSLEANSDSTSISTN